MGLIEQCVEWGRSHPRTVVFPESMDERALTAVQILARQGSLKPVLLGNPQSLQSLTQTNINDMGALRIVDPSSAPELAAYSQRLLEKMRGKAGISSLEDAAKQLQDPLWFGAMMLDAGDVDAVVAGNLSSTVDVLHAALRIVGPAEGINTVSSLFFMIEPDTERVLAFADCGVMPQPNTEQLADIAISTADSFRNVIGEEPRIAMLSFSTMGSVKHRAVTAVRNATQLVRERRPDLLIEGELQFDTAFSPDVAQRKVPGSVLGGNANVFIFPDLNSGNIAYKIAQRMGGYTALGPMIQGLRRPMHDLSRGCSAEDMVQVALLAMKMAFGKDDRF